MYDDNEDEEKVGAVFIEERFLGSVDFKRDDEEEDGREDEEDGRGIIMDSF